MLVRAAVIARSPLLDHLLRTGCASLATAARCARLLLRRILRPTRSTTARAAASACSTASQASGRAAWRPRAWRSGGHSGCSWAPPRRQPRPFSGSRSRLRRRRLWRRSRREATGRRARASGRTPTARGRSRPERTRRRAKGHRVRLCRSVVRRAVQ
eukprot:7354655-Prymnesium_polylepis.3